MPSETSLLRPEPIVHPDFRLFVIKSIDPRSDPAILSSCGTDIAVHELRYVVRRLKKGHCSTLWFRAVVPCWGFLVLGSINRTARHITRVLRLGRGPARATEVQA
jgi:hypothetical protein